MCRPQARGKQLSASRYKTLVGQECSERALWTKVTSKARFPSPWTMPQPAALVFATTGKACVLRERHVNTASESGNSSPETSSQLNLAHPLVVGRA